jgi:hypothetical protein
MNGPRDTNEAETADEGGGLDPREAATLIEQTKRQARRQFALQTPLLALIGAAFFLVAYGTIWLSVREQHPYQGPTGTALGVFYGLVIVMSVAPEVMQRPLKHERPDVAASAYAGPIGVWPFVGVGCCVAFLGYAAAQVVWPRPA